MVSEPYDENNKRAFKVLILVVVEDGLRVGNVGADVTKFES